MSGAILCGRDGPVLRLVIDNPDRANALDPELARALVDALPTDGADVRVVELRGAGGRSFCSGFDLGRVGEGDNTGLAELMEAVACCPVPVVAVVAGHAVGAGLELACRCDLRIARRGITLGLPAVRLGVAYRADGIAVVLRTAPGARHLLLTGDRVAVESVAGFADVLADGEEIEHLARSVSAALAAAAPAALGYTLRLVRDLSAATLDDARRERSERERADIMGGGDVAEALLARGEGRQPRFAATVAPWLADLRLERTENEEP